MVEALSAAAFVMIRWVQSCQTNSGTSDDQYLGRSLANAVRWARQAQDAALAAGAAHAATTACENEARETLQKWTTSAWLVAQDVQGLGTGNFVRVSQSTLTRTIKVCRDFDGRGCSVRAPHCGRARAAFYAKVAYCLATYAHTNNGQVDVRLLELALERATKRKPYLRQSRMCMNH